MRRSATAARPSTVGIERLHLEQDAGKSLHDQHPTMSYVDLNRSGVALMEIVSKPDTALVRARPRPMSRSCAPSCAISAPATATWRRAPCAPTSTCRCASPGEPLGTRCEIKNVNSIRFIGQAIEYEARRQIEIIEDGGTIDQETRLFDPEQGRDALDALQGRGARLSLFPRSRPAAARIRRRPMSTSSQAALPELPDAEEGALHRRASACRPTTPACWWPSARAPIISRQVADRARDAKLGGQLGDQRAVRPPQQGRPRHRRQLAGLGGAARRPSST